MEVITISLAIIILIVTLVHLFFRKAYSYWKIRGVPYEEPIVPLGNSKGINKTVHLYEIVQRIYKKFKGQAPFCGVYLLTKPFAIITDLDLIKDVLIRDFNYFTDRGIFYNERDDPLSAHLFTLDGHQWRFMRTKLTPTFSSGKMKFMFPTIMKVGNELKDTLSEMTESDPIIEIRDVLARYTTDVIGTCAFGIECNSLKDPDVEFRVQGKNIFKKTINGITRRAITAAFPKLARALRMKVINPEISSFFLRVVRETVKYREENGIHRNDFLDILLDLKNSKIEENGTAFRGLSVEEIAAQVFVFFLAGFETSSTTMGFCLYELALNPKIQDKLREEILQVIQKHNGKFTYEAMSEMTLMEQVINETLRKYPPVPILTRKAVKDYAIPKTKFIIEKDMRIFIPVYPIHHDPEIYPDPQIFDPDRFSSEEMKNRHSCAFLPFGDGPRNCIGLRFGKMQTRIGLVVLLQNFKFEASPGMQIPLKFVKSIPILTPELGIELKITKL